MSYYHTKEINDDLWQIKLIDLDANYNYELIGLYRDLIDNSIFNGLSKIGFKLNQNLLILKFDI